MSLNPVETLSSPGLHLAHSSKPVVPRDRLLRLPEVEAVTGCKKSTIYKLMKDGRFPPCRRITARMAAWPESAVLQWVQDRIHGAGV
jgi:prophage regulatory protein